MSGLPTISLGEKIEFLESVVIPSFDESRELESEKRRKMRFEGEDLETAEELVHMFDTISTLEKELPMAKQIRQRQLSAAGKFAYRFYLTSRS